MCAGCEKETAKGNSGEDIAVPDKDSVKFVPVERLVFKMNGKVCGGGEGDSIKLYEEGLRTFSIAGYEPAGATVPVIDSVNFYRDIYAFSYNGNSVYTLGGDFAAPKSHYVSPVGKGFEGWRGMSLRGLPQVRFYNYVNRSYDYASIEFEGETKRIRWRDIGLLRKYRIEVVLRQNPPNKFTFCFYELENRVTIQDTIRISPGETLQLDCSVESPYEFDIKEWAVGYLSGRTSPLNAEQVNVNFQQQMNNHSLTEDGRRYTASKVHLSPDGILAVDADWDPQKAMAAGGAIYNTLPICVICMPEGDTAVMKMKRLFSFPGGKVIEQYPTPFYAGATVQILSSVTLQRKIPAPVK